MTGPALYEQPPHAGEVWVRRGPPQETRSVIDRNLGGDVIFIAGRYSRLQNYRGQTVSLAEWREWAAAARQKE